LKLGPVRGLEVQSSENFRLFWPFHTECHHTTAFGRFGVPTTTSAQNGTERKHTPNSNASKPKNTTSDKSSESPNRCSNFRVVFRAEKRVGNQTMQTSPIFYNRKSAWNHGAPPNGQTTTPPHHPPLPHLASVAIATPPAKPSHNSDAFGAIL
jgi:hypothetical protein